MGTMMCIEESFIGGETGREEVEMVHAEYLGHFFVHGIRTDIKNDKTRQ